MAAGDVLWEPTPEALCTSRLGEFMRWLRATRGIAVESYSELHEWSIRELDAFWADVWQYFDVIHGAPYDRVRVGGHIADTRWFVGGTLNFAENALRGHEASTALVAWSESRGRSVVTVGELRDRVARARTGLQKLGVGVGDRVGAYLPNTEEAVVAYLATASLGAIWSSCAPESGARHVIDRFRLIEPKVLIAADGYRYRGTTIDKRDEIAELQRGLPALAATVVVPHVGLGGPSAGQLTWSDFQDEPGALAFERVPFNHPLAIVFTSGTTGPPKPIVHGHGGIVVEHLKFLGLQHDLGPGDRFFWFTTTGWVMWNILVSGLLVGATIVLFDGDPAYPDMDRMWSIAEAEHVALFGAGAGFYLACRALRSRPADRFDLSGLRVVGSTGSPLPSEGFEWVYEAVKPDVVVMSGSGGTEVGTGFVTGSMLTPVYSGEMSCRALGCDVDALDQNGTPVLDTPGELIVRSPMPSMPVGFWGDEHGHALQAAYFADNPGVWTHGDWIVFRPRGSCVILGRSDATLNRGGVRLGTADFYTVVEELPEVEDSLIVHLEDATGAGTLMLFVVVADGHDLTEDLRNRIRGLLRESLSPRHVPDEILQAPAVPRTISGKKLEVPVKRILLGAPASEVTRAATVADSGALGYFESVAATRRVHR
jgi:acetoacetyl-CoA synthetase